MTVTLTTTPTYPVPGRETKLRCLATVGNYIKLYLTSCPPTASDWYAGFKGGDITRQLKLEIDHNREAVLVFPSPGVYTFVAEEITKGASTHGGSYLGDPASYDAASEIGESTITVKVGQRMTFDLGSGADTAKLGIYVWDTTCRPTNSDYHGEVTPCIFDWRSDKAQLASLDSTVVSALPGLVNVAASTIVGSVASFIDNGIDKFNAHLSQTGVHASNDSDNAIDVSYKVGSAGVSVQRMSTALAKLHDSLRKHMTNDSGAGPGSATTDYHAAADNKRCTISDGPADAHTNLNSLADWRRIFTGHIGEGSTIHSTADTINTLTASSPILTLLQAFFSQLATTSPVVPSSEQSAVVSLMSLAGFEKAQ